MNNSKVFDLIYKFRWWGKGSGTGAVYSQNKPFVDFVNRFLEKHKDIKKVVEIGCGDWQLSEHYRLGKRFYIGCDVSSYILDRTRNRFSAPNRKFFLLDAVNGKLPNGDLVIIKDVLQHLSNDHVLKILLKLDKYKYKIIVNDVYNSQFTNKDIKSGWWRTLDITKPPFNFGGIKKTDEYTEGTYRYLNRVRKFFGLLEIRKGIFSNI